MKQNNIKVHFLGAAETVTGSKYLIDTGDKKIMVDCGMFQGLKELRDLNWEHPPFNPKEIDVVLLSHGHLDHSAYLPKLVNLGFNRFIIGTKPTLDVAGIIILDSAKIQEEDAERANKEEFTKHNPAKPLYTAKDAQKTIEHFKEATDGEWFDLFEGISVRFQYNGHIIGATFIELNIHGKRFVFSGDIGRIEDTLLYPPKRPDYADILFTESTYGNRLHPKEDVKEKLKEIILKTIEKKGTLIIPSFAVERTQNLMYLIWKLTKNNEIPKLPLIMDSPMGANVLNVFQSNSEWHKLSNEECAEMISYFRIVRDFKETWEVIDTPESKIIIAGSGMITGGRILTYLKQYIEKPETSVLLVGYQAEGTRGRDLLEGVKEIKFYGKFREVKAKIHSINGLSAHADQAELIAWMSEIKNKPEKVFILHGEPEAAIGLQEKIKETYGWHTIIPKLFDIVEV
jgi:metallo-beta-lactamase family protein